MSEWAGRWRRADVVVLTTLPLEYDGVLQVDAGAVRGSTWERTTGPSGLPLAFRLFDVPAVRPLRVAVAVAADMGATAATNVLLPLVDALKPRCVAMCGVCAGRPEKTQLGDVVAASRLFYHDTGKRLPGQVQHDVTTYQLRDDWKAALAGMDVVARFRDAEWFRSRPLTTTWRVRRALVALHNGDAEPWRDIDAQSWATTVGALREQGLIAGREPTDEGRRVVDELLFSYQGRLPDLSPAGDFQPFRLHVGPMASGSQVIEDKAIWDSIAPSVRTILALEMEGAALGQLAHCQRQYGLDAVVMKAVMDFADQGRDDHFKVFAARASAECLLAFLRDHVQTEAVAGFDDLLTTGTSPPPDHRPSPSSLLVARHAVVPWHDHGREQILAELDTWADEPGCDVAVRLLHAAGGVGKTRLAIEWVRRRRARCDVAGFLDARPGADWLDRLCGLGAAILLIIDYAESRADLGRLLERLARYADTPGPRRRVRMLLLARSDGDWWTELQQRSDALRVLMSRSAPLALTPLATSAPDREGVFMEAATVFAAMLGTHAVARPPISLADPRFERVLYVHMAALASVEGIAFDAGSLMDMILDHEQRFWRTEAATRQQATIDVELAQEIVVAATLRGGIPSKDDTHDLCARLARRPRSRDDDAMIALLRQVYDRASEPHYLPALEPDLLGEAMVVRVAAARHRALPPAGDGWIERVFVASDDEQALTTAFTVLGRASVAADSPLRAWIARLLETDLVVRAVPALRAAKIVGHRTAFSLLGDVLAEALEQRGPEALAHVLDEEQIPRTVSLARVASWRSRTLLDGASVATDMRSMARRAQLLREHAIDLREAGQREAALAAIHDATELYRELARRNAEAFQSDLAGSLHDHFVMLSDLGQHQAALVVIREAVALYRQEATRHPDAPSPGLSASLYHLGSQLSKLGQLEPALAATQEAVELQRQLARQHGEEVRPGLAHSLANLGIVLRKLGRLEVAFEAIRDAVVQYRLLARHNPDAYQPHLATVLHNMSVELSSMGHRNEALAFAREALELRRQLAARYPDAFQPDLASSLAALGATLGRSGHREAALAATRESVELRRQLASRNPEAFQPELANSLSNLGLSYSELGQDDAALAATRESVELRRQLASRNPEAFQSDLARSLLGLGVALSRRGEDEAALAATRESVELRRQLVKRNPGTLQPELANSLNNLGVMLSALGQHQAALSVVAEAAELYLQLSARNPGAYQDDLAMSLTNLGLAQGHLGQLEVALANTRNAVELYRQLAKQNPAAFQADLATSLHHLGQWASGLGSREQALAATREAVELRRQLAMRHPGAFRYKLATSLNSLGKMLSDVGLHEDSAATLREAEELRSKGVLDRRRQKHGG